jgi:hypothetical protein
MIKTSVLILRNRIMPWLGSSQQCSFALAMKKIFAAIQPVTAIPSERLNRRYHTS